MSDALRRYKLTYTSRVKNGPNEVDFVDDWPLRRTQGVLPWVEAGSALLCLCDLCEIGPHRFTTFDEALLKQLAPDTNSDRFDAFMHWFGHQCAWVDFQEVSGTAGGTHLIQPVCWIKEWPDQDHLRTLLFTHVGPVADLLLWGSHPQLLNCYERCHLPITSPALRIAAVDEGLAGRLELEASKEVFSSNWHFHNFNRAVLEGGAPDRYIPYAYRAITTSSSALDSDTPENSRLLLCDAIGKLRNAGLLIEEFYEFEPGLQPTLEYHAFSAPARIDHTYNQTPELEEVDSFLGALRVALTLLRKRADNLNRSQNLASLRNVHLRYAYVGNRLYSQLDTGDFKDCLGDIVLFYVSRTDKTYANLLNELKRSPPNSPYVIFFGRASLLQNLLEHGDVTPIPVRPNAKRVERLTGRIGEFQTLIRELLRHDASRDDGRTLAQPQQQPTIAAFIWDALKQDYGINELERAINRLNLIHQDEVLYSDDCAEAMGLVVLATLFELLCITDMGTVPKRELQTHYSALADQFDGKLVKDPEQILELAKHLLSGES